MAKPVNALNPVASDLNEVEIGGQLYEVVPAEQFRGPYDRMELYLGKFARPNPPPYLIGSHPDNPDQSPAGIRYWRRRSSPFVGS